MHVAVVGAGINGLCSAWALAREGHHVTLIERGPIPNPQSASCDHHRMIRAHYPGQPVYARRVAEAFEAWELLWRDLGARLYVETGVLALSTAAGDWTDRASAILDQIGVAYERLTPKALAATYPFLDPSGVAYGLLTMTGGALLAERIVVALARHLARRGVAVRAVSEVREVDPDAGRLVLAAGERIDADALVVAAGHGLGRLLPDYAGRVVPIRSLVVYVDPPLHLAESWRGAPGWVEPAGDQPELWGLPPMLGLGPKLGCRGLSRAADPSDDREATAADAAAVVEAYRGRLRDLDAYRVREARTCFYARAPEERFLLEPIGRASWVVSACSGHGFKFGALTGLDVAAAVTGARSPAEATRLAAGLAAA
jgi:sarcosine oxidase